MKKNYLAALLALTMGATAIAGCGAKPSDGQTSGAAANDGSKTEAPGTNKGEASDSKKGNLPAAKKYILPGMWAITVPAPTRLW